MTLIGTEESKLEKKPESRHDSEESNADNARHQPHMAQLL